MTPRALFFLERAGFEVYLPRVRERRLRYGRRVQILAPLFPGYCFTRIELQWRHALACPGVRRVVLNGGVPVQVPDKVIAKIQRRERNGVVELPTPRKLTP